MVARKFRKGEVDWQALTHATSCSIVRAKGKTIEDKSLRRIVDIRRMRLPLVGMNIRRKNK